MATALKGKSPPINIWQGVLLYHDDGGISLGWLFVAEGAWNSDLKRCPINPPKADKGMANKMYMRRITRMVPKGSDAVAP